MWFEEGECKTMFARGEASSLIGGLKIFRKVRGAIPEPYNAWSAELSFDGTYLHCSGLQLSCIWWILVATNILSLSCLFWIYPSTALYSCHSKKCYVHSNCNSFFINLPHFDDNTAAVNPRRGKDTNFLWLIVAFP